MRKESGRRGGGEARAIDQPALREGAFPGVSFISIIIYYKV
jgi:hypothetical protein